MVVHPKMLLAREDAYVETFLVAPDHTVKKHHQFTVLARPLSISWQTTRTIPTQQCTHP